MSPSGSLAARTTEAILTTLGAAALGGALGLLGGMPLAIATSISAGVNGAFGGWRQVHDWRTARGWFAFVGDSTWGLLGTTLGNMLNLVNLARPRSGYRADLSRRRDRHLFEKGVRLKRGFAFTLGNVISNASTGRETLAEGQRRLIDRHEDLHIWQNRIFGPLYPATYLVWFVIGVVVGVATWVVKRGEPKLTRLVETAAYYDNPFEYWAYQRDNHWEDNRADPLLKWRRPKWRREKEGS